MDLSFFFLAMASHSSLWKKKKKLLEQQNPDVCVLLLLHAKVDSHEGQNIAIDFVMFSDSSGPTRPQ